MTTSYRPPLVEMSFWISDRSWFSGSVSNLTLIPGFAFSKLLISCSIWVMSGLATTATVTVFEELLPPPPPPAPPPQAAAPSAARASTLAARQRRDALIAIDPPSGRRAQPVRFAHLSAIVSYEKYSDPPGSARQGCMPECELPAHMSIFGKALSGGRGLAGAVWRRSLAAQSGRGCGAALSGGAAGRHCRAARPGGTVGRRGRAALSGGAAGWAPGG